MPQQTLDVHRHLAVLCRLGEQGAVKVAVHQSCEMVDLCLHLRQLPEMEGVAHPHGGAGALFLVGGEILVADGAGGPGGLPVHIGAGAGEPGLHVGVGGIQLGEYRRPVPAFGRREAGGHHRAPHFPALVALIVDVLVQGYRPNHQHVIVLFCHRCHSFEIPDTQVGPNLCVIRSRLTKNSHFPDSISRFPRLFPSYSYTDR